MSDDLRSLIRQILAEELQGLKAEAGAFADTAPKPQVREEAVSLNSDQDLNRFVLRVLELAQDGRSVQEIKAGRWRFRLQRGQAPAAPATPSFDGAAPRQEVVSFERGLISERQVAGVPQGAQVRVGKRVRFTPLALDELRRKGVQIERKPK